MAVAAQRLVDGRGTGLVANALTPRPSKDGRPVYLRPAVRLDAEKMYAWQQAQSETEPVSAAQVINHFLFETNFSPFCIPAIATYARVEGEEIVFDKGDAS